MVLRRAVVLFFILHSLGAHAQDTDSVSPPPMDTVEANDLDALLESAPPTGETVPSGFSESAPSEDVVKDIPVAPEGDLSFPAETETPVEVTTPTSPPTETPKPDADAKLSEDLKASEAPATPAEPEAADVSKEVLGGDDLEVLKKDLKDTELSEGKVARPDEPQPKSVEAVKPIDSRPTANDQVNVAKSPAIFDVGREEKQLLEIAGSVQGQISNADWNELATQARVSSYTVVKDDWLFKISKRLFGSGFYYPKIWALNAFITNPHLIEPGMVLSFTTGSGDRAPEIKLGEFTDTELKASPGAKSDEKALIASGDDFSVWGDEARPDWLAERKSLIDQGVYVQYSTTDTIKDLEDASRLGLIKEYEGYEPPASNLALQIPPSEYDKSGFDRNSKIVFKFKEGFYLNTFVTNNPVQDFGKVDAGPDENMFFTNGDHMYIVFDDSVNALAGDRFSVYVAQGKIKHPNSDREGHKYSITGQVRLIGKIPNTKKWEAELEVTTGLVNRGDRITVYTPKIERITQTFNGRLIEAAIVGSHSSLQNIISSGDVVYIDRGRADGVEMGNVFEMYGFKDRSNGKVIAEQPTYKTGELTVITLTDNFATCLVTRSVRDFYVGDIAITKTKEAALKAIRSKGNRVKGIESNDGKALEELDVELKVEDLNDSLLDKADKVQLTEDELAELERQEREKSIIKDSERDLKALERLENEIEDAEKILNDAKKDEDKLLDNSSLEEIERAKGLKDQESLDEIEENLGKRYMDEDINNKDNPFGLTEFDVEEVDELLNVDKQKSEAAP